MSERDAVAWQWGGRGTNTGGDPMARFWVRFSLVAVSLWTVGVLLVVIFL